MLQLETHNCSLSKLAKKKKNTHKMKGNRVTKKVFQKTHTWEEIANYIMDLDAPKLRLDVQPWHNHARTVYSGFMVSATTLATVLMLITSLPEFYFEDLPDRGLSVSWLPVLELVCVLYFTVDYAMRFYVTHRGTVEFLINGFNIIDVLTIFPFYLELMIASGQGGASGLGVLFFVRALRLAKLGRYSEMLMSVLHAVQATYDVLLLFLLCYCIVVFVSGTVFFYVENTMLHPATKYWLRPCPDSHIRYTGNQLFGTQLDSFVNSSLFPHASPAIVTMLLQIRAGTHNYSGPDAVPLATQEAFSFYASRRVNGTVCADPDGTGTNFVEPSPVQSVPDAIYWGFVVTSTLGTRLQAPVTAAGKVVAAIAVFLGVLLFAVPVTLLTAAYRDIRRKALALLMFHKIDIRTTVAMKAQEQLKRELSYAQRNRDNSDGSIRFMAKRTLEKVATFEFEGVERPIYQAVELSMYHYPPLVILDRHEGTGQPRWTDDFNPVSSQRVVSCLVMLDCEAARRAARLALCQANVIDESMSENDLLVCADPRAVLSVRHDFKCSLPRLNAVVEFDALRDANATFRELIPLRFVIPMSHVHPSGPVIQLLRETRVAVTIMMPMQIDEVDMPLSTDIVMASQFVRELSQIGYRRPWDSALLAYVHHSDGAELLKGFTEQFVPTPTRDDIILDPYFVDTQLFHALTSALPRVSLSQIPPEAARAFYRGKHLSVDLTEEKLIFVNLTALQQWDLLGFGQRFRVIVPMARIERTDVQFQLS